METFTTSCIEAMTKQKKT